MTTQTQERAEARELARLGLEELGDATGGIGAIHLAIAERAFGVSGPGAAPARVIHDRISKAVYSGVRYTTRAAATVARHRLPDRPPLSHTPRGAAAIGVLNGLIGDVLEEENSPLAQEMTIRVDGRPVPPTRQALRAAFPDATGQVVVFVHGLMGTELPWAWGGRETYGARLRRDLGFTPVELRYNTGRRISRNGRSLSELMQALAEVWPVSVGTVALVGHSMGGLVARSACHCAIEHDHRWVERVTHVVTLGTPHTGAPLENLVHYGAHALNALPETRPFARFLRRRSGGIRDLRRGSLVDADWDGRDPDDLRASACQEIPLLDGAVHCFVSASLRPPLDRVLGDWLVLESSATARGRLEFDEQHGFHLRGAGHMALLNHDDVYAKLREWLA